MSDDVIDATRYRALRNVTPYQLAPLTWCAKAATRIEPRDYETAQDYVDACVDAMIKEMLP